MSSGTKSPRWWQLYALIPAVVGLFAVDSDLSMSRTGHQVFQAGIVVAVFMFVQWWLSANRYELMEAERHQARDLSRANGLAARRMYTDLTEVDTPPGPMFHLPPAGLRHTLEDTFDLDVPESDPAHRRPE